MVALKTTEAMVPGSNPAATIVENSENRLSHNVTSGGNEGNPPTRRKKEEEKKKNYIFGFSFGFSQLKP